MRLDPWEPDIRTLISRIREKEIDLQPDFQRGLAWNQQKQAKLIDTILRGWSVPPMHFLVYPNETMAVLDGQQRLTSIFRFTENKLKVGKFAPDDPKISALTGSYYSNLDPDIQRRFQNFTIRSYRLHDYSPEEPHELFFRLNQPTGLTQAEKRNALMGSSRSQVRGLVKHAESAGWSRELLGFENARLAYDDIIARVCVHLQERTLRISTNAAKLEQQFRSTEGFSEGVMDWTQDTISLLSSLMKELNGAVRLNKATLLSWLLFFARGLQLGVRDWDPSLVWEVESGRAEAKRGYQSENRPDVINAYISLYDDRASLRVADILSVVARDACLWRLGAFLRPSLLELEPVSDLIGHLESAEGGMSFEASVLEVLDDPHVWGNF
ncbi:DUF262 domain-containing protein [Actinoplanes sp. CA-054009]